jgi:hypothetical protein
MHAKLSPGCVRRCPLQHRLCQCERFRSESLAALNGSFCNAEVTGIENVPRVTPTMARQAPECATSHTQSVSAVHIRTTLTLTNPPPLPPAPRRPLHLPPAHLLCTVHTVNVPAGVHIPGKPAEGSSPAAARSCLCDCVRCTHLHSPAAPALPACSRRHHCRKR